MNIIMLGAPGAGKGTLATEIKKKYNLPHVSTGDLFRENIKNETELGKLAKSYIEKGALVPDEVTINMLLSRIDKDDCKNGFILDGFPRNLNQADGLKEALKNKNSKINLVILVEASDEKIIKRLAGRRVCEKCGKTYHIEYMKPKEDGICDDCGGKVVLRKDDTPEVIKDRLDTYHKETQVLIDYYKKDGVLKSIDGFNTMDENMKLVDEMMK